MAPLTRASSRGHRAVVSTANLVAGGIAGAVSTAAFTVFHQIFINSIWWMFPIMLIAGIVSGVCLAWCYAVLVPRPSPRSWTLYVAMFTGMFGVLALASSAIYEPIITMAEVLESTSGNPVPVGETLGLMLFFTLSWAGLITWFYGGGWRAFGVAVITTSVLMLFLGFNVSTLGLVEIPTDGWVLMAEFFGYIAALGGFYGAVYAGLARWPDSTGERVAVES